MMISNGWIVVVPDIPAIDALHNDYMVSLARGRVVRNKAELDSRVDHFLRVCLEAARPLNFGISAPSM